MMKLLCLSIKKDTGGTAIEYSLIAGLIAMVIIAALTLLGTGLEQIFTNVLAAF